MIIDMTKGDALDVKMSNGDRITVQGPETFEVHINKELVYRRKSEPSAELLETLYLQNLRKRKYKFL